LVVLAALKMAIAAIEIAAPHPKWASIPFGEAGVEHGPADNPFELSWGVMSCHV